MLYITIPLCIIVAGFFAGLETGLLAANQLEIYSQKEKRKVYAVAADFLLLRPERLLATTLVGTNVCVVTAAVLLNGSLRRFELPWVSWTGTLVLALLFLVLSEIIPKSFFRRHADTLSVRAAPALVVFYFLFLPVSLVLNGIVHLLLLLTGQHRRPSKLPKSKEDLRLLVKLGGRESGLPVADQRIIEDIFDFRETMAREVMSPFHELPAMSIDASIEDAVRVSLETGIRYVPVYVERADDPVGYVDVEAILRRDAAALRDLASPAVYYPDTKKIPDLLMEMNRRRLEVVFLSDEYGTVVGMLTSREIASEIVGYVPGDLSQHEEEIRQVGAGHYLVSGTADLEDLAHETGVVVDPGSYDTLGGFLCERLGEIPEIGATHEEKGVFYRIIDRDDRHIRRVEVLKRGRRES